MLRHWQLREKQDKSLFASFSEVKRRISLNPAHPARERLAIAPVSVFLGGRQAGKERHGGQRGTRGSGDDG
ncbi:MAG: hypothetical protein LGL72_00425, partial [Acidibrevibacterium sp.]|uniref:hypothetical protein n=1 Tax=Acidibrevibacterium fodinaquatile TaxID=1969806 RepID=UPI0023A7C570